MEWGYRMRHWRREWPDKIAWWVALKLPRRVALLAFVRVMSCTRDAPGVEYDQAYKAWVRGEGR